MDILKDQKSFGGRQVRAKHTALCGSMEVSVYLPPEDKLPAPAVYFLSGLTCTPENFTAKAGAQRIASELGLIVVAPDTSPRGAHIEGQDASYDFGAGASFYVDATEAPWSSQYSMYTYIQHELPIAIDAAFETRHGERSIMGHSMGGHGALVCGLREPDAWHSISAFSPICAPSQVPWGKKAFTGYLGTDESAWRRYDATELVQRPHRAKILIDQGLDDEFLAEQLKPELFEAASQKHGQPLELRKHAGYDHSYYFIASFLEDHLRHHARHLLGVVG